jgi:hypothetical protein
LFIINPLKRKERIDLVQGATKAERLINPQTTGKVTLIPS